MFTFLEAEGAHVLVDPIGNWVMYLMHQAKANADNRRGLDAPHPRPAWWQFKSRLRNEWHFRKKWLLLTLGERIWNRQYTRVVEGTGQRGASAAFASRAGANWRIPSTTPWPAAAKVTWKSAKMSTTPSIISAIWCWP